MDVAQCSICGGEHFQFHPVLWPKLIADWQLSPDEALYIDKQQGKCCTVCGANLRSMALGNALKRPLAGHLTFPAPHVEQSPLRSLLTDPSLHSVSLLEINEAGTLSPALRQLPGHIYGAYPEVDMHALPFADASLDIVVHSDTLEHVQDPVHALGECRRVLKRGAALCLTIPVVIGRMTRCRAGLPVSSHSPSGAEDYMVHTEFGADAWTYLIRAGFSEISVHSVEYPSGLAFCAIK